MLHAEQIEAYCRMTPRERIAEMRELIRVAERALAVLPPDEARRRLEALDRIRRESIEAFFRGLAVLRSRRESTSPR